MKLNKMFLIVTGLVYTVLGATIRFVPMMTAGIVLFGIGLGVVSEDK